MDQIGWPIRERMLFSVFISWISMFGVFPAAFLQAFRVRPVLHLKRRYLPEPARPAQGISVRYRKITGRIAALPDVTGCIGLLSCRYVFHLRKRIPIHALDAGKSPDPVLRAPPEIEKLSSGPPFLTVHGLACNSYIYLTYSGLCIQF
ncbi:hypothetical protein SAMN05192553_1088 [Cyclobacterium xiamenense]|uniref:Uncharacterized protein n=1 Tax=Cyclobacterium xiamenense TaxID=1297121 RepID=A0A1H7AP92_9BACT|nr:hypothetical protein SAMN05192553_1088 [Cyclobacterium xiamenense]